MAAFTEPNLALLAAAVLPGVGHGPAFRLRKDPDPEGHAIESRDAWGDVVGHLAAFDQKLFDAVNVLHSLIIVPESLANLLETAGAEGPPPRRNPPRRPHRPPAAVEAVPRSPSPISCLPVPRERGSSLR